MGDLESLLPGGKGVWIPIDHGVSDFPVNGLENLDEFIHLLCIFPYCPDVFGVIPRLVDKVSPPISTARQRHAGEKRSHSFPVCMSFARFSPRL